MGSAASMCETLSNSLTGTNTVFCHQVDQDNTALCLSSYTISLNHQLKLDDCNAVEGGRQNDELWWYGTGGYAGVLLNYGDGDLAVSQGNDNSAVNLGRFSGAANNYWTLEGF